MTTLELLRDRRRAAMEQHRRDFEDDIYDYDDVDGHQTEPWTQIPSR